MSEIKISNVNSGIGKLMDKVVLVIGGGGGIGWVIVLVYVVVGVRVVVVDINVVAAQVVVEEIIVLGGDVISIIVDLICSEQVEMMVEQVVVCYGLFDIVFNNVGIEIEQVLLVKISEDIFDDLMDVNVKGVWFCMKYEIE